MDTPKGLKLDHGKLTYHLQDDAAEAEMVAVLTFGAVKYDPGNWAHVEAAEDRYYDAARRHLAASRRGEILDPETNLATLAHAACCVHFLLALELRRHPKLADSLSQRLGEALEVAKKIRAEREASTRVDARDGQNTRVATVSTISYELTAPKKNRRGKILTIAWSVRDERGHIVKKGFATSKTNARKAAEAVCRARKEGRGTVEIRDILGDHARDKKAAVTPPKKPARGGAKHITEGQAFPPNK